MGDSCNVVCVCDQWYFIDVYQASPHTGRASEDTADYASYVNQNKDKVTMLPNEFFFLVDPKEFIYFHLPNVPEWQLLEYPISIEEFECLASVGTHFFEYGMELYENSKRCIIIPTLSYATLDFGIPIEISKEIHFDYRYYRTRPSGDSAEEKFMECPPSCVQIQTSPGKLTFTVTCPIDGEYMLEIYGAHSSMSADICSDFLAIYAFKWCCELCVAPHMQDGEEPVKIQNMAHNGTCALHRKYLNINTEKSTTTNRLPQQMEENEEQAGEDIPARPSPLTKMDIFYYKDFYNIDDKAKTVSLVIHIQLNVPMQTPFLMQSSIC